MTKLRVYVKNGGVIKNTDFKKTETKEKYIEYADRFINETIEKATDFSIFDPISPVLDGARGTQLIVKGYGKIYDKLIN